MKRNIFRAFMVAFCNSENGRGMILVHDRKDGYSVLGTPMIHLRTVAHFVDFQMAITDAATAEERTILLALGEMVKADDRELAVLAEVWNAAGGQ